MSEIACNCNKREENTFSCFGHFGKDRPKNLFGEYECDIRKRGSAFGILGIHVSNSDNSALVLKGRRGAEVHLLRLQEPLQPGSAQGQQVQG
jgi:hypothetical protein